MLSSQIDYASLVEQALLRVVHDVLGMVAEHGLPGRHHLYITFRTDHAGVVMDEALQARYPTEMTIVLQHEFWGLEVSDDRFAVTLSFNNVSQRLEIPFAAVTVFADPSVEFGLQFTVPDDQAEEPASVPAPLSVVESPAAKPALVPAQASPKAPARAAKGDGAEVVALDRFRKK
jgi:hypothetical protein